MQSEKKQKSIEEWIEEIHSIDQDDVKATEIKFAFEQGEKLLKDSVDTSALITARTTTLLTLLVGFILALVGYAFNRYTTIQKVDCYLLTSFFTTLYLYALCGYLVKNIKPAEYIVVGTQPKLLFIKTFYDEVSNDEKHTDRRLINFYFNEMISYQKRIETNDRTNKSRWADFNTALWGTVLSPIVLAVIFAILKGISRPG